jgi:acyl dehydratase
VSAPTQAIEAGAELPPLKPDKIMRMTLAIYAGASGDHNPVHIDSDIAKAFGLGDVFGHGMLTMAYAGRMLTDWADQRGLREFNVRFSAITHVGEELVATGTISEVFEADGEQRARIEIQVAGNEGEVKAKGQAVVATDSIKAI